MYLIAVWFVRGRWFARGGEKAELSESEGFVLRYDLGPGNTIALWETLNAYGRGRNRNFAVSHS